ncbi:MAG TPA: hypothetical protein O0X50_01775 [Methanocorpusculum sp.]|nr:hypothetical protein [Methanocorpusculum sp.]
MTLPEVRLIVSDIVEHDIDEFYDNVRNAYRNGSYGDLADTSNALSEVAERLSKYALILAAELQS